jgi:predicted Rossmann fold nucleotide-binding protein DprA/Smf involved in DNA uptake
MVLDLIAVIAAAGPVRGRAELAKLNPEHRKLLRMCQTPVTVADTAADVGLPLGVVRVLLSDLIQQGMITVLPRPAARQQASTELLKEVLDGLRSL